MVRLARFEIEALSGSAARAQELLHGPDTTPHFAPAVGHPALDAFLKARTSGRPADAEAAAQALLAAGGDGRLDHRLAVRALAVLGRTEDAFALMADPRVRRAMYTVNNGFLLEPSTAALRQDPRFWPIAARVGLVAYWTQRGAWPDFCGREVALATCKAGASATARALGGSGTPKGTLAFEPGGAGIEALSAPADRQVWRALQPPACGTLFIEHV
jgi:hypothetical protein